MTEGIVFKQYYLGCLAHESYLLGDPDVQTAVVIDPQRDIDQYLEDARQHNLRIAHVFLTHFHADFLAGHLELRDREGARIYLGAKGEAEYSFVPMKDGDVLEFGRVRLKILETPGHTPESISILWYDLAGGSPTPHAVFTGDTLFIGDVGRPDLRVALGWAAADLGSMLYRSLRDKLLALPDSTLVYPAHGAGSMCGKSLSKETVSTIGAQRRHNYALQPMTEQQFVALVLADQPEAPPYFTYDAVLNTKERPTLERTLEKELRALSLDEVLCLQREGAQVVDVREQAEFAAAHLANSTNIGLGGKYATWAGTILERGKQIVIVAGPGQEQEAAVRLGRIGYDWVAGYLENGMKAAQDRPDVVQRLDRIDAMTLSEELHAPQPPVLLDVRAEKEWSNRHIEGGVNIPLSQLRARIGELPRGRRVVVHCAGGYRSCIAASLLQQDGFDDLADLVGGIAAWEASSLDTASSAA